MFEAIGNGMAAFIVWLYGLTVTIGLPSFGLAIIMVTILIKVALHPLTRIQMRSMAQMSQLQPEIKKIQDAYGKDKQKMQQKMMELYKERKVNPMSGCLLLLIQLPILIALYRALFNFDPQTVRDPEHLRFLWVPDLTAQSPGPFFWQQPQIQDAVANVAIYDPAWAVLILPLLAAGTTYWQAKLSMALSAGGGNPTQESMQRMMLTMMPVFIGYISAIFPAGLALYWVTFNAVGIVQQAMINKQLLTGKPAEQKETAATEYEGGGKKEKAGKVATVGEPAPVKNPAKKPAGDEKPVKGRRGKPGKEEVAKSEGGRRKRKKRGGGG